MSGEIETAPVEQRKRRPIPIFEDRFAQYGNTQRNQPYIDLNKPYLRKNILAEIGNNLNELVEIKTGGRSVDSVIEERKVEKPDMVEERKEEKKIEIPIISQPQENISTISKIEPKIEPKIELKIEPKVEFKKDEIKRDDIKKDEVKRDDIKKDEIKRDDIKIGISNLVPKTEEVTKEVKEAKQTESKKPENKQPENNKKIIKRKVNKMGDEDDVIRNLSQEDRRRLRAREIDEVLETKELNTKTRKSAELIEKNKDEIEKLNLKLNENREGIQKELENKFNSLDSKVESKFGSLDLKFTKVNDEIEKVNNELGTKLKETCDGIECLKKDFKKFEFVECPECGQQNVKPKSSFCPDCGVKIHSWTEDDGVTPLRGWKPNWLKNEK